MKYKVIDYVSGRQKSKQESCELCLGTAMVENGSITVEDKMNEWRRRKRTKTTA